MYETKSKIEAATPLIYRLFPEWANEKFVDFLLWNRTAFPFATLEETLEQITLLRGTMFVSGEGI